MQYSGQAYMCSSGESFDSVALAVYGDEKYAAELMCFNPDLCGKAVFSGGELLYLPVIEAAANAADDIAPWRA